MDNRPKTKVLATVLFVMGVLYLPADLLGAAQWVSDHASVLGWLSSVSYTWLSPTLMVAGGCLYAGAVYLDKRERAQGRSRTIQAAPKTIPSSRSRSKDVLAKSPEGTRYLRETPVDLCDLYTGRASALADQLLKPFVGERMKVTGTFNDLGSQHFATIVSVQYKGTRDIHVMGIVPDEEQGRRMSQRKPDEDITITGDVLEATKHTLTLDNCRLGEVE